MNAFPFSTSDPVVYAGAPPASADVVIIGGGIIGITTALYLARRGIAVTVLEKGRVAAEQSSRNWGWIRKQGRDAAELPIMIEASSLWQQLARSCDQDIGLRQTGITYLAESDKEMAEFEPFLAIAAKLDVDTRLLDGREVSALIPSLSKPYRGAMVTPSDMRAEPWVAVPALARLAAREGARIVENCAARTLDVSGGKVAGVWSEAGHIAASTVLVAGGAWSSLLLQRHNIAIPQLSVRATAAASLPLPEIHAGAAVDKHIAFRRRQDGGYTLAAAGSNRLYLGPDALRHGIKYLPALKANPFGTRYAPWAPSGYPDGWSTPRNWSADAPSPFEQIRVLNPTPDPGHLRAIEQGFARLFPGLGPIRLNKRWAGMIDAMPDVVPIIDRVPSMSGLLIATGMSGHGFGIGPAIGRIVADMIQGNATGHDLHRFRFSRFTDGSPIQPGPSL